jgi:methylenetetrahydrofolate reductase (NADPH)
MDNNIHRLVSKIGGLKGRVVAVNFSDNAFATSRMSSLACSKLSLENGLEPVMQIQARDRSRNGILSEVMGASALGIRNILCLGGDYHNKGPRPRPAQPVQFDLDSVQMLWLLRRLRDEGRHLDGREVEVRPAYFLGAAGAPFTLSPAYNAIRVEEKIHAGAQFIQTQMVFDTGRFSDWLEALDKRSLLDKVYILAGVCPLRSLEDARFLASEPGISIPAEFLARMQRAAEIDQAGSECFAQAAEGMQIAVEIIDRLRHTAGIRGIHLMVGGQEESLPWILEAAGV